MTNGVRDAYDARAADMRPSSSATSIGIRMPGTGSQRSPRWQPPRQAPSPTSDADPAMSSITCPTRADRHRLRPLTPARSLKLAARFLMAVPCRRPRSARRHRLLTRRNRLPALAHPHASLAPGRRVRGVDASARAGRTGLRVVLRLAHSRSAWHTFRTHGGDGLRIVPGHHRDRMRHAGFTDIQIGVLDPPEGGRPFTQATVLARKPGT